MLEHIGIKWFAKERLVSELKEWEQNPRKIKDTDFARLKDRLVKRGMHDVLLIDTNDVILSGNMRKKALVELNVLNVFTLYPERPLSEEERTQIALESNRNDGMWDYDMLANEFDVPLLLDIGFEEKEIYGNPNTNFDNELDKEEERLCFQCGAKL